MEKDILEQTEAKTQLQEELEASRGTLEESKTEVKTIQQQLNTTVGDLEVLTSQMKDDMEEHLRQIGEIQSCKEKVEAQLEEEISQRVQLEALKVQLTGFYEEKQAENEKMKEEVRWKDEEIENLTHDMEITRTSHLNKEALLTSSNDRIQALTVQMGAVEESHRCEVEKLEAEGRERLDQLGSAGEEMGRLQTEVAELKTEMERREELCKEHMEAFNRRNAEAEALKTRTSHVSLEHVAAMEKARLLEENNTRLQEEMDKVEEERASVDEMMIRMGAKEQELHLELQQEKETVRELSENWDKRGLEIEVLEKEKTELRQDKENLERQLQACSASLKGLRAYAAELKGTEEKFANMKKAIMKLQVRLSKEQEEKAKWMKTVSKDTRVVESSLDERREVKDGRDHMGKGKESSGQAGESYSQGQVGGMAVSQHRSTLDFLSTPISPPNYVPPTPR